MDAPTPRQRDPNYSNMYFDLNQDVLPGVGSKPHVLTGFPGSCSPGPSPCRSPCAHTPAVALSWVHRGRHWLAKSLVFLPDHAYLKFLNLGISQSLAFPRGPDAARGRRHPHCRRGTWDHSPEPAPFPTAPFPTPAAPRGARGPPPPAGTHPGALGSFLRDGLIKKELLAPKTEPYLQMSLKGPGLSGSHVHLSVGAGRVTGAADTSRAARPRPRGSPTQITTPTRSTRSGRGGLQAI